MDGRAAVGHPSPARDESLAALNRPAGRTGGRQIHMILPGGRTMPTIDAFEAGTRLPELLRRVADGERFVITRHRRAVAELIPCPPRDADQPHDADRVRAAIAGLKAFQDTHGLGGLSVRALIEEGRRS